MEAPAPDTGEEMANSGCHGIALIAACLAIPKLLESALHLGARAHAGVMVFAATMVLLYGASTAYHALPPSPTKQWFLKLDHGAIHLFIAGSYTPFALFQPHSTRGMAILSLVWAAATAGFWMTTVASKTSARWATCWYLAMGWLVLLAALSLIQHMPSLGAAWLIMGGAAYTMGIVFYVLDSAVRYAHAVWHGCVAAGTTCHVFAVLCVMAHTTA